MNLGQLKERLGLLGFPDDTPVALKVFYENEERDQLDQMSQDWKTIGITWIADLPHVTLEGME